MFTDSGEWEENSAVRINVNALTQVSRSAMPRGEGVEG